MTDRANLRLVDTSTGELHSPDERIAELEDQLAGAHKDIRAWRTRYANLERDKARDARASELWPTAIRLFDVWKQRTGHTRSQWTLDRFFLVEPMLATYGPEMCERAIAGIAHDPYTKRRRNGTIQRFDSWKTCFSAADTFEEMANRAPRDWTPTLG